MNRLAHLIDWSQYSAMAEVLGNLATTIGVLIAVFSIAFVFIQSNYGATVSREINAFQAHKDYLQLCVDHPELSSSTMMLKHLKRDDFVGILDELTKESERCLWFFSYVLFAMEQMALNNRRLFRVDPAWRRRVQDQLSYHVELLEVVWPAWQIHYSRHLDALVQKALLTKAQESA
jgi:hypothetical protein